MGLLKSTGSKDRPDASNPIIISASGDTSKLDSTETKMDSKQIIGDKLDQKLSDIINKNTVTIPKSDNTIVNSLENSNKNSEPTNVISHLIGNANKNTGISDKLVKMVDLNGILTATDGVGVEKVITYPKDDYTVVKANGNASNVLSSLITGNSDPKKIDGDTSKLNYSSANESSLISEYEKTLSKVIGYSTDPNSDDLSNAMTRLADEASKIVKVTGSEDVRNYLRTTLNAVGALTTPSIMRVSGVSEVVKVLKSYGGDLSDLTGELDNSGIHTLINSAIARSYVKKVNNDINSQGINYKGYGMATNKSTVTGIDNSYMPSGAVPLINLGMDYSNYLISQNAYMVAHFNGLTFGPLLTKSIIGNTILPDIPSPMYNAEVSLGNIMKDRRTLLDLGRNNDGLFVAYDQALWDISIDPYTDGITGSNPPPKSPFDSFFPAVDVSIDDVDTSSSVSVPLPWDRNINLPGDRNIPSSLTIRIYENQYLIVDQWLHNIMDHIYEPDGKGGYRLANFKDSSYLIKYYFLDPQLRAIKRLQYLAIPDLKFNYNGSDTSALQDYSITFNIVGADHY